MKRSVLGPRGRMGAPVPRPNNTVQPGKRAPITEEIAPSGRPGLPARTIKSLAPTAQQAPKPRGGVPDAQRAAKGLSLAGLLKRQPRYMHNSAEDVVVKALKHKSTRGGMPAITGVTRDRKTVPQRLHKYSVIGLNASNDKIATQKRIKVSCDCEFFLYYSEYALWTWGAANIVFSNGQPAHVRNPGNVPILCKHLTQVLHTIYKNNL